MWPQNMIEWCWFGFFVGGTMGGWAFIALHVYKAHKLLSEPFDLPFVGEFEEPEAPVPAPTKHRVELPVYKPRKRVLSGESAHGLK